MLRVTEPRTLLTTLAVDASMVVVGSRGLGAVRSVMLGSVGRSLIRRPTCPVVVHRPRRVRKRIPRRCSSVSMAAHGPSPSWSSPSSWRTTGTSALKLLHCFWQAPGPAPGMWSAPDAATAAAERREVAERVATLTEKFPQVPVVTEVVRGDPQALLDATSEHQAMVVVGAHHHGLAGLLPLSVTTSVVDHARCPVAVVPVGS